VQVNSDNSIRNLDLHVSPEKRAIFNGNEMEASKESSLKVTTIAEYNYLHAATCVPGMSSSKDWTFVARYCNLEFIKG
jgi:hypothetical protein